ncbi:MAG: YaaA family protein [Clostridia bacterium]|nr:YaaA family protein [Clostridia bacterium]
MLSPARNMRPAAIPGVTPTRPIFWAHTLRIVQELRQYGPLELESLLETDPAKAMTLVDTYQRFDRLGPGTPALTTYSGLAFHNLAPADFTGDDFAFAQEHLRILSALHGLLRPYDGIVPHRLGLDRRVRVEGQDLYAFWGDALYKALFPCEDWVVSLASKEFIKLITPYLGPADRMLFCEFYVQKPEGAKATPNSVKTARGQMARFIIQNRIDGPEGLKDFDWGGYRFIQGRSGMEKYVFIQQRETSVGRGDLDAP